MRRRTLPRVDHPAKLLTAAVVVLTAGAIVTTAIVQPGSDPVGTDAGALTALTERRPDPEPTGNGGGTQAVGRSGTGILADRETESVAEAIANTGDDPIGSSAGAIDEATDPSRPRTALEIRSVSPDGRPTPSAFLLEPATPRDPRLGTDTGCTTGSERPTIDTATPRLSAAPVLRHEREVVGFEVATVAEPSQAVWTSDPVSLGGVRSRYAVTVPDGVIAEGQAYAWRMRSSDGTRTSAWSAWCEFAVDVVPAAPVIRPATDRVETIYLEGEAPSGAIGREGRFVLGSGGPADIVTYEYRFSRPEGAATSVVAATVAGTAEVAFRPDESGAVELSVTAIDAAGQRSPISSYVFTVADQVYSGGAPHVPWSPVISDPYLAECVTGSGRPAINSTRPKLTAVGTHAAGGNLEMRFEVALADDPATVIWTGPWSAPMWSGSRFQFQVPSGVLSGAGSYAWRAEARQNGLSSGWSLPCEFDVDVVIPSAPSIAPVDDGLGAVYLEGVESGGVGKTGRFRFASADVGGVMSFRYSFSSTAYTTVPADSDGTAEIAFTPTRGGPSSLTVRAVDRAGNLSPATTYSIDVAYW